MSFLSKLNELFGKKPVAVEKPVELKKRTMKLVSRKEMVDLGVTYVMLKFKDGRELVTKVYGSFSSSASIGTDEYLYDRYCHKTGKSIQEIAEVVEPKAIEEVLVTSLSTAQKYIDTIQNSMVKIKGGATTSTIDPAKSYGYNCPTILGTEDGIKFSTETTENTYVDCPRVPTKSEVGKVITATILRTESNLEEVTKYSVEKI